MKRPLSLGVGMLLFGLTLLSGSTPLSSQNRDVSQDVHERFQGAWRLAWLEEVGVDGTVHKADCIGSLVFTRDGHMSVQVMYRNPQVSSAQYAQGGYEASFGKYEIDESTHTFMYHVEGALVRSLIGKDLTRVYAFSGRQLIVKSAKPDELWRVAWEHY